MLYFIQHDKPIILKRYAIMDAQLLLQQEEKLHEVAAKLKEKFVGLDDVIDEIINKMKAWYFMADHLERPQVINLWGLTGSGKTSLIKELLKCFEDEFYSSIVNVSKGHFLHDLKSLFEDNYHDINGNQAIIVLDEFQHARTVQPLGEVENTDEYIWHLLDDGSLHIDRGYRIMQQFNELIQHITILKNNGISFVDGSISGDQKENEEILFKLEKRGLNIMKWTNNYRSTKLESMFFLDQNEISDLLTGLPDKFTERQDIFNFVKGSNTDQLLDSINELKIIFMKKLHLDCSKFLIFIIGNLDEAFRMYEDFNQKADPDVIREHVSSITIDDIRQALKCRFRVEQIARLGTAHIVYPTLSGQHYRELIQLKLDAFQKDILELFQISLEFDQSISDLLMKHAVFPTLGVRILENLFQSLIISNVPEAVFKAIKCEAKSVTVLWDGTSIMSQIIKDGEILSVQRLPNQVEKIKSLPDGLKSLIAVHESGHAISTMLLLKEIPGQICVDEYKFSGRMYNKHSNNVKLKGDCTKTLAVYLSGYTAEKIVFGESNISNGSQKDIQTATQIADSMIRAWGFGKEVIKTTRNSDYFEALADYSHTGNDQVRELMASALILAEETLLAHKDALLKLAKLVYEKKSVRESDIELFTREHYGDLFTDSITSQNKEDRFKDIFEEQLESAIRGNERMATNGTFAIQTETH